MESSSSKSKSGSKNKKKRKRKNQSEDSSSKKTKSSRKTRKNNNNQNNSTPYFQDNGLIRVVRNQEEIDQALERKEEIREHIDELYNMWTFPADGDFDPAYLKWCLERFDIENIRECSIESIEKAYISIEEICSQLYHSAVLCGLAFDGEPMNYGVELDPNHATYLYKISAISSRASEIKQMIISCFKSKELASPYDYNSTPFQEYYIKHIEGDSRSIENLKQNEIIFMFIKNRFFRGNKRKYKNHFVYEQVYNRNGYPTMAWKPMREIINDIDYDFTIEDYIQYELAQELYTPSNSALLIAYNQMSAIGFKHMAEKISISRMIEFKNVNTSRRIFSFENGAYITCTNMFLTKPYTKYDKNFHEYLEDGFYEYATQKFYFRKIGDEECHSIDLIDLASYLPPDDEVSQNTQDDYNSQNENSDIKLTRRMRTLPAFFNMASCNHLIDVRFPVEYMVNKIEDWKNIPTPKYDSILTHQDIPQDAIDYTTAMNGRVFHEVGEFDDAQLHVQYKGVGRSGKSLMLKIPKKLFGSDNTGTISDKMEDKFGLGYLQNKLVYIIPEVSKSLPLTQQLFQSMISGESIYNSRKNIDPTMKDWKINGMSAGNLFFPFTDKLGNIMRRFLFVIFNKTHEDGVSRDESFEAKLDKELGFILLKMNRAYLSLIKKEKFNTDFTASEHFPQYFKETRKMAFEETNILPRFIKDRLKNEKYLKDENESLLLSIFKKDFNEYKRNIQSTKYEPTDSELIFVLKQYDLYVTNIENKNAMIKGIKLNTANEINEF